MAKKEKELHLPIRRQIAFYVDALLALEYNQKTIAETIAAKYGYKLGESALTKAKCLDEQRLLEDYIQRKDTLSKIEKTLGRLLWEEVQQTDARKTVEGIFAKESKEIGSLYHYASNDINIKEDKAAKGKDEEGDRQAMQTEAMRPYKFSVIANDYIMSLFKGGSALTVSFIAMLMYFVAPYLLALVLERWSGIGYGFGESITMLVAYPLSAIPIAFVFLFYQSVPEAFYDLGEHTYNKLLYQQVVKKVFATLPSVAKGIWFFSIGCVIWLHMGYLEDGVISFLEDDNGVPNLLYFINIILYTWHLFMFLYTVVVLSFASQVIKSVAYNYFMEDVKIFREPQPLTLLLPLGKPLPRVLIILIFSLVYALCFSTSMYNVSQEAGIQMLLNWQFIEIIAMFLPLVFYGWVLYTYVKHITQLKEGKQEVTTAECYYVFIYLVTHSLVFLPRQSKPSTTI